MTNLDQTLPEWDLSALYPSQESQELKSDFLKLETNINEFINQYRKKVTDLNAGQLVKAISEYEGIQEIIGRIMSFAYLVFATDMASPEKGQFYQNCEETINGLSSKTLFFVLEINHIPDDRLAKMLNDNAELKNYKPWIDDLRVYKPYQLDEKLEKLMQEKSVVSRSGWTRLFRETVSKMKVDIDGRKLSTQEALNLVTDPNGKTREKAARALSEAFNEKADLFSHIMNTLIKDKAINDEWRGMPRVDTSRNLGNFVEDEIVDSLVNTVQNNYSKIPHRFYKMKAKWLGKEKLNMWDLNAPLRNDTSQISWTDAKKIVLDAYGSFSPEMADIGKRFFDENWIDAKLKDGKAGGAFAHPTVPSANPYILVNYQGKLNDVTTLAHELGHGIHQYLAYRNGYLMADTSIVLSETASVFGEMLTFQSLLDMCKSEDEKNGLIASKVQDMLNTVMRQIAFYQFEKAVHEQRREGELSLQDISKIWVEKQKNCLGDAFEYDDYYKIFWCYIPHFIEVPFYVYGYAFGECLVNSLYAVYQNKPEGFVEKYRELLAAGGTNRHKEALAPFGLDAKDPEFWQNGLTLIQSLIDQIDGCDIKITD